MSQVLSGMREIIVHHPLCIERVANRRANKGCCASTIDRRNRTRLAGDGTIDSATANFRTVARMS